MAREAVIVAATRTAVGRSKKGSTRNWRSDELAASVIRDLMAKAEGVQPEDTTKPACRPRASSTWKRMHRWWAAASS